MVAKEPPRDALENLKRIEIPETAERRAAREL